MHVYYMPIICICMYMVILNSTNISKTFLKIRKISIFLANIFLSENIPTIVPYLLSSLATFSPLPFTLASTFK